MIRTLLRESLIISTGRLVVSVSNAEIAGLTLHDALGNQENRAHYHNFTATTTTNEQVRRRVTVSLAPFDTNQSVCFTE